MQVKNSYLSFFIIFVVLAVYYPAVFAEFNSVDDVRMVTNLLNLEDFSIVDLFLPGGSGYYYRPLLGLTFIFDMYAWGLLASFMHLENIVLHAINSVLIFFIALRIFSLYRIENKVLSLSAALLFALHPVNTEPVNWVSGRTDLLAGVFIFASLLLLLIALEKDRLSLGVAGAIAFFIGCLAKESAVFFFPAALFCVYCFPRSMTNHPDTFKEGGKEPSGKPQWKAIKGRAVYYAFYTSATAGYFIMRHFAFKKSDSGITLATRGVVSTDLDIFNKLRVTLKIFGFYIKKLFIPWPLNFAIVQINNYYVILGILTFSFCIYLIYKRSFIGSLFVVSACIISPALLIPLGGMAWTPVAERYLYMPSAMFSIAMVFVMHNKILPRLPSIHMVDKDLVVALFLVIIYSGLAYTTFTRNLIWQNNLTLFQDTVKKSPEFAHAKNELAIALKDEGRSEEAKKIVLSIGVPEKDKSGNMTELNKAIVIAEDGDLTALEDARKILLRRLEVSDQFYMAYLERLIQVNERLVKKIKEKDEINRLNMETIDLYKKMQKITGNPFYYYRIGQYYLTSLKNTEEARSYFALAYETAPQNEYYKEPARKLAERLGKKNGN